jgi:UBX domain-containing protein 1
MRNTVRSLNDKKKEEKQQEEEQEVLSQSGTTSGTAVIRPTNRQQPDTAMIAQLAKAQQHNAPLNNHISNITLYRNGFLVDNGTFRHSNDPNNAQFIQDLLQGNVPEELRDTAIQRFGAEAEVGVNLINKTNEDYNPGFVAFQSQGFSLGSASSGISAQASFTSATPALIQLDPASLTTTIQLISHSGQRIRIQVNHANTVLQLYQHIMR